MKRRGLLVAAFGLGLLANAREASAQDHSWRWPLYTRYVDPIFGIPLTGQPRPAVWGGTAEYQAFSSNYLHPGSDIRGNMGDPAIVPVSSTVLRTFRFEDDCVNRKGAYCRAWFQANPGRYIYYISHVAIGPRPDTLQNITTEIREAFERATNGTGPTNVTAGQRLAVLADFGRTEWHHLHIGIFDTQQNYALMHAPDFFEQLAKGENGESLAIVDDERPIVSSIELVPNGRSVSQGSAVSAGVCGPEVSGDLDIIADMHDTFFTSGTFNDFPGRANLNPVTGIRSAGAEIRRMPGGEHVDGFAWYDLAATSLTCGSNQNLGCIRPNTTPSIPDFLNRMALEGGAPSAGLSVLPFLFDTAASTSIYGAPGGERYFHVLTNRGGVEGSWNTAGLPNGRYQITVSAVDFAGIRSSLSRVVTVRQPGSSLDLSQATFGDIFLKDHAGDVGSIPSNGHGEAWWESPDIFIVPKGQAVNVFTPDLPENLIAPGNDYDVYVRVRNAGCSEVRGVRAKVLSADPAAFNTGWRPVTPAGQFVGDVTVPGNSQALLGPFPWRPTPEEAGTNGHRCLIAAVSSASDPLPDGREFDAPNFNNVAQRNLQIRDCSFELPNTSVGLVRVALRLETDAAVEGDDVIELTAPADERPRQLWSHVEGTSFREEGGRVIVRMRQRVVSLPPFFMGPGEVFDFTFRVVLKSLGSRTVRLFPTIDDQPGAGFSCTDTLAPGPK